MKLERYHYYFLFVIFIFLGIVSINLFSDGMFIDGLTYADISRNMSEGLGSFWKPHLTDTLYNEFYEHPPLAFGLQSLWFKVFGDSIYVERFYSLTTFIIVGYTMILIWKKITGSKKDGWIALLLWILIADVSWAAENNILENTMSIFICLSFLFYLYYNSKKQLFWIILSGLSLSLALLTKGFVCLYILTVPFFMWIFTKHKSFIKMSFDSVILIIFTIIPIAILYFFIPEAHDFFTKYFTRQIIGSFENIVTVENRLAIIIMFFNNIILPLIVTLILFLISVRKKLHKNISKDNIKISLMFFAIVLSGVLPIIISLKQRSFYITSVYPFFAIGLAYLLYPVIRIYLQKINDKGFKIIKITSLCIIVISLVLSISQINRIGRDKEEICDCKAVIEYIGEDKTINICTEMYTIWSLHEYFSRYGNISLEALQSETCRYYLTKDNCNSEYIQENYVLVPLNLNNYELYKLIEEIK